MVADRAEIMRHLEELAERRVTQEQVRGDLARDIRASVQQAQEIGIPIAEIARLLRLDRSTLYRTYLDAPG